MTEAPRYATSTGFLIFYSILIVVAMFFGYFLGVDMGKKSVTWPHSGYSYKCGQPMKDAAKSFYEAVDGKHFRTFTLTYTCP